MDDPLQPPRWLRWGLVASAVLVVLLLLVMPLAMVLGAAFSEGVKVWAAALTEPDALAALELTLMTAAIVIPLNAFFGLATAWAVTRFEFRGKQVLLALVDLPFAVSPVVAGLCLVLLFGREGWFASLLDAWGLKISSRAPASCSRPCSSPSRSSRAN
jgi:sulfate/thiosulfate transport system permease protein